MSEATLRTRVRFLKARLEAAWRRGDRAACDRLHNELLAVEVPMAMFGGVAS